MCPDNRMIIVKTIYIDLDIDLDMSGAAIITLGCFKALRLVAWDGTQVERRCSMKAIFSYQIFIR